MMSVVTLQLSRLLPLSGADRRPSLSFVPPDTPLQALKVHLAMKYRIERLRLFGLLHCRHHYFNFTDEVF